MIDNLIVFVKNIPIVITMPPNIVIPIGGCSLPNLITLENLPYESVEIQYEYDPSLEMDLEISTFSSVFDKFTSRRYISFC